MDDNLALALPATATPVARQPSVSGRPVANKNASGDRGTFAVLCLFQRLMIQLSRIVISHALNESLALRAVNKKCENTYGRIYMIGPLSVARRPRRPVSSISTLRGRLTISCL